MMTSAKLPFVIIEGIMVHSGVMSLCSTMHSTLEVNSVSVRCTEPMLVPVSK